MKNIPPVSSLYDEDDCSKGKDGGGPLHLMNKQSSNSVSFGGKADTISLQLIQSHQAKLNQKVDEIDQRDLDHLLNSENSASKSNNNKPP